MQIGLPESVATYLLDTWYHKAVILGDHLTQPVKPICLRKELSATPKSFLADKHRSHNRFSISKNNKISVDLLQWFTRKKKASFDYFPVYVLLMRKVSPHVNFIF